MGVATLLDKFTGKPKGQDVKPILSERGVPLTMEENYKRGWRGGELSEQIGFKNLMDSLPDHVQINLRKSSGKEGPYAGQRPPMADHSNYQVLRYWITADTSITAAAETIMVPAFNFYNSEMNVGSSLRMALYGSQSAAVTTPGTFIYRMRWGGVAGALQATSSTLTPSNTAVETTVSFALEYWMTVRTTGASGTMWTQGNIDQPGLLLAAATSTQVVTYLANQQIPATAAAIGASTDFTAAAGPTPTYQPSLGTANCTTHICFLESLN